MKSDPLICLRVIKGVSAELFHSDQRPVTFSPSIHDTSGKPYDWETFGELPEWTWKELTDEIGEFQTKAELKKKVRAKAPKADIGRFKGDFATLDILALVQEVEL